MCDSIEEGGRRCPLGLRNSLNRLEKKREAQIEQFADLEDNEHSRALRNLVNAENDLTILNRQLAAHSKRVQERLYENPNYAGKAQDLADRKTLLADRDAIQKVLTDRQSSVERVEVELGPILTEKKVLDAEIDEVNRQLNTYQDAMNQLQADADNPNLSDEEREEASKALKQAIEDNEKRLNKRKEDFKKQTSLRRELESQGIPAEQINTLVRLVVEDKGQSHLRSYKYYFNMVKSARSQRKALREENQQNLQKIYKRGLGAEKQSELVESENARYKKADAPVLKRIQEVRLSMDATVIGQAEWQQSVEDKRDELKERQLEALADHDTAAYERLGRERREIWSNFESRRQRVVAFREAGLSDRRKRENTKAEISRVVTENGGSASDAKKAVDAYVRPTDDARVSNVDPMMLKSEVQCNVTAIDEVIVEREFQSSREYAENGEAAYSEWIQRKVMANPRTKLKGHTLDEVFSTTQIFDQGKKSRHPTSMTGLRELKVRTSFSEADKQVLKSRASSLHMTVSSYARAMIIPDENPWRGQNDRSPKHRYEKLAKCRELLETPSE